MAAWAKRLHPGSAEVVTELDFGNQAASSRPRDNRRGDQTLIDHVLRVAYQFLELSYPPSHRLL